MEQGVARARSYNSLVLPRRVGWVASLVLSKLGLANWCYRGTGSTGKEQGLQLMAVGVVVQIVQVVEYN